MSDVAPRRSRSAAHLDAIRAISALMVFFGHLRMQLFADWSDLPVRRTGTTLAYLATSYGHEAVMAFFVLSGYLVGSSVLRSLRAGEWSWARYLVARLSRLWIVLVPALALGAIIDGWGMRVFGARFGQVIVMGPLTTATWFGNLFFLQDIQVSELGSNGPLWSLSSEFWYYVAFPFVALAFIRRGILRCVICGAIVAGLMCIVGTRIATHFPLWLLGTAAAELPRPRPRLGAFLIVAGALGLAGVLVVTGTVTRVRGTTPADFAEALVLAILLVGLRSDLKSPGRFYGRSVQWLAGWSYSLYLTHFPMLVLVNAVLFSSNAARWQPAPLTLTAGAVVGALVLLYSYGVSRLTEAHTDIFREFVFGRLRTLCTRVR